MAMVNKISDLKHVSRSLPGGGRVVVLNTGALIGPESDAMLQALNSRSIEGLDDNLTLLAEKGPEKFMSTFYVGYGHKSIGDCGTATLFIEGVSMLAAKAIQDNRLYSGQESSTRYIDFAKQRFINPLENEYGDGILETWRKFYLAGLDKLIPVLMSRHPRGEGEKESVWEKAIKARAFDIMRAFLPAGASTNVAWHSNLRQFADKLEILRHHPLDEVSKLAEATEDALLEDFPNSFSSKRYAQKEEYNHMWMSEHCYNDWDCVGFASRVNGFSGIELERYSKLLLHRPEKTELPAFLGDLGTIQYEFLLDFGSYRDIQRQRSVYQRMPLLTARHGFHKWYLEQLPNDLCVEATGVIASQREECPSSIGYRQQYYLPMGYQVPNRLTGGLPAFVYIAELRATRFVHPTLCARAVEIADHLRRSFGPYGLVLHLDKEPSRFDIKRGEHDIVKR